MPVNLNGDAFLVTCRHSETGDLQSDWSIMLQYTNYHHSLSSFLGLGLFCSSGLCLFYAHGKGVWCHGQEHGFGPSTEVVGALERSLIVTSFSPL